MIPTWVLLGVMLFAWTLWAVLFWGSIAVIERHNPFNKFAWALVWGVCEVIVSVAMNYMSFAGLGLLVLWLVFLMRLLLGRYELGVLHALGVVIVTVVGPYFVADSLFEFAGESEVLSVIVLFGFPVATFAVWLWARRTQVDDSTIPSARVTKHKRPAARAATPAPAAPPKPVIVPVAPPAPAPPRPDGEPSILT